MLFKAARLFHPGRVTDMHPDATTVLDLKAFLFPRAGNS